MVIAIAALFKVNGMLHLIGVYCLSFSQEKRKWFTTPKSIKSMEIITCHY